MPDQQAQTQHLAAILQEAIRAKASDVHLVPNSQPMIRIDSTLRPVNEEVFTPESLNEMLQSFMGEPLYKKIASTKEELDFSFAYESVRFRCNVFYQRGSLAASLRLISHEIPSLADLGLPAQVEKMVETNQGLLIVAGPTGHGKSTTIAALINKIASERRGYIITVEDPVEYVFEHKKSLISQREVGFDTPSFPSALRAALREDPDVVILGEMRDQPTMEAALQIAETGHLVLTTLHTNSAAQTTNRIIDIFPSHQQSQIRVQLSEVLLGIVSQRLLAKVGGGRILAAELLLVNPAVRSLIREGKSHQLPNLISTSGAEGMISLDASLAALVNQGLISVTDALSWSLDPKNLKNLIYSDHGPNV